MARQGLELGRETAHRVTFKTAGCGQEQHGTDERAGDGGVPATATARWWGVGYPPSASFFAVACVSKGYFVPVHVPLPLFAAGQGGFLSSLGPGVVDSCVTDGEDLSERRIVSVMQGSLFFSTSDEEIPYDSPALCLPLFLFCQWHLAEKGDESPSMYGTVLAPYQATRGACAISSGSSQGRGVRGFLAARRRVGTAPAR